MKLLKFAITGIGMGLATLMLASTAMAVQENAIILIDRSGSMGSQGNVSGATKWEIALDAARDFVSLPHDDREYELWTYSGTSLTAHYTFADGAGKTVTQRQFDLLAIIDSLPGPTNVTPLAGSFCEMVDILMAYENNVFPVPTKRVYLLTDGLENATLHTHPCWGVDSTTTYDPSISPRGGLDIGSWEWKVLNKAITGNPNEGIADPPAGFRVLVDVDELFNYIPTISVSSSGVYKAAAAAQDPKSTAFFKGLAEKSGGQYKGIAPNAPLPVLGDVTADGCVNYYDYQYVVNYWGQQVSDDDSRRADLNRDDMVDYYDYLVIVQNWGTGC